jgi:predicted membrane protein
MKKFAGIILLVIGAIVLLCQFGHFFLLVLMASLAFLGVKKLHHARTKQEKNIAYLFLGIAALCGLFNIPFLFTLLLSGALLYFGWKLIDQPVSESFATSTVSKPTFDKSFDADWQEFVNKNKNN